MFPSVTIYVSMCFVVVVVVSILNYSAQGKNNNNKNKVRINFQILTHVFVIRKCCYVLVYFEAYCYENFILLLMLSLCKIYLCLVLKINNKKIVFPKKERERVKFLLVVLVERFI